MSKNQSISNLKINRLKQQAKKLSKEKGIPLHEALHEIAKQNKFGNWDAVVRCNQRTQALSIPTPDISLKFVQDEILSEQDNLLLKQERYNDLKDDIKLNVLSNKTKLIELAIEFSIFEPTRTGLSKSILDATNPVRIHFELTNFHFYFQQKQGADENKVLKDAYFLTSSRSTKSKMSLYRPKTKNGDPRMWFSGLNTFAQPEHQIVIIIFENCAYLINLNEIDLNKELENPNSEITKFLNLYLQSVNDVADELLKKLKIISKQLIKATHKGDTAVGMSIENALGIKANSSKEPDYKGIELKSKRKRKGKNRSTLFAQVANWTISPYKSSADILNRFGYQRDNDFKLYCTIKSHTPNSQGLFFKVVEDELQEWSNQSGIKEHVASWSGDILRNRLKEKHAETFWIEVETEIINKEEYFRLVSVTHTKSPLLSQLMPLIESGVITMDHLIKRSNKNGRVSEKGPLFKIDEKNISLLFPKPVKYLLQ